MTTFNRHRRLQTYSFGCSWRILVPGTRHVERPQRGRSSFSLVGIVIRKNSDELKLLGPRWVGTTEIGTLLTCMDISRHQ
jgi:hypothetical protein